ncbi:MAG TPA: T9SS type A sorting domain-containing protein [Bacteroidetes bacterium]|nr:T9SS type A sorting domain-containing protein [Bacteroidota bacterium]
MRLSFLPRLALAALALALSADLATAQARLGPGLRATLDALRPAETLTVVVTFDQDGPLSAAQTQLLSGLGITKGITFQTLPIAGVVGTRSQIEAIANLEGVRSVWPNHRVSLLNAEATELTGVNGVRTDAQFRRWNGGLPVSGRGVGVVVHDSGVDGTHPDLQLGRNLVQNVLGSQNLSSYTSILPATYIEDVPTTDTNSGHGTHVAGTVGGTGAASGGLHEGVAPGADLIGYGSGGVVLVLDIVGGFDYAIANQFRYGIRVITNSWGSSGAFDPADPVNEASYRAYQRGISVFFAAGNDGPSADTHNPYSQAPWVVSVAAGNKDGQTLADFSSRGNAGESGVFQTYDGRTWTYVNEPDVTAPGVGIISPCGVSPLCATGIQPDNPRYSSMQGTSMATPHVAGIAALMLEANPQLTPDEVYAILRDTATELEYEAWEAGAGYVNAYASVAAAYGLDPTPYLRTIGGDGESLPEGVVLVDDEGDGGNPGTDIADVSVAEDGDLLITLRVPDLAEATPSTLLAAGFQLGAMQDYSVEFDLLKADATTVRYQLSARRTLVSAGLAGFALDAPSFDYGVRAADGSGRGMGEIPGTWDAGSGRITWTVSPALLTVAAPPADLTGDIDQSGRAARAGDRLAAFSANVATSLWAGALGITPGQTSYDSASGTASYTIGGGDGDDPGTDPEPEEPADPPASGDDARVVVSVIDSGINPYHDFYNAGGELYPTAAPSSVTQDVLDAFGIDEAHTIRLTRTGDFAADFAADAAVWANVQPGELYWFAGTNVMAISYDPGSRILLPDDESDTHGVGTSAAVLRANPDAIVVFVEGITDASETFAFTHPEIDIVSTSYGAIGSLPLPYHINNSYLGVVTNGKLHIGAADNSPSTAIQDGTAGPWWSIGVAGFEEGTSNGRQLLSGTLPDVVGDFTQTLPYCAECESGQQSASGTSFATPRTAGTISKVLLDARRAAGHTGGITDVDGTPVMVAGPSGTITNWEIRRAMEEAAYVPTLTEYDPVEGVFDQLALPVPEQAAFALVGWGVVSPDLGVVEETLAQLGVSGTPRAPKGAPTCTFMESLVTARHLYWDNLAVESESFLIGDEDPYLYCSQTGNSAKSGDLVSEQAEAAFGLEAAYPNPVRQSATVAYVLPAEGAVRLAVYDLLGREVAVLAEGTRPAGAHTARFDSRALAAGAYLVRLDAGGQSATRRLTVVK